MTTRDDRGVATVYACIGIVVLLAVTGLAVHLGAAALARQRAETGADLAALAGRREGAAGPGCGVRQRGPGRGGQWGRGTVVFGGRHRGAGDGDGARRFRAVRRYRARAGAGRPGGRDEYGMSPALAQSRTCTTSSGVL